MPQEEILFNIRNSMRASGLERPNIAVAGLTAAGKTTHATLLADTLGYRYISATEILLELIGIDSSADRAWFEHSERIRRARAERDIDAELDRRLVQLATEEQGLVLDSWAIAWTCASPMIRLWLDSTVESRTWKCYVSQGAVPQNELEACRQLIHDKDTATRELFLGRHGFDLFTSRNIFDAVLNNSDLIRRPTRTAADAGISAFAPVVSTVVKALLHDDGEILTEAARAWSAEQRACVTHINR